MTKHPAKAHSPKAPTTRKKQGALVPVAAGRGGALAERVAVIIDLARILHEAGAESGQGFSGCFSWLHYHTPLKVNDPAAHAFHEIEAAREKWMVSAAL